MIQRVSVSGIIIDQQKILVVRRAKSEKFFPGFYEFPGGKVEFGENPENAVVREVKEETGLTAEIVKIVTVRSYLSKNDTQHNIELFYNLKLQKDRNQIVLSKEHDAYLWVDKTNLDATELPDDDPVKLIIKSIFVSDVK